MAFLKGFERLRKSCKDKIKGEPGIMSVQCVYNFIWMSQCLRTIPTHNIFSQYPNFIQCIAEVHCYLGAL